MNAPRWQNVEGGRRGEIQRPAGAASGVAVYPRSAGFQSALGQHSPCGSAPAAGQSKPTGSRRSTAFSLIELLVVIGVIVVLAGMTFPVVNAVKRAQAIHRAKAELAKVELAIQAYKEKLGFYPPDNPPNWTQNQLYYELLGTTATMAGSAVNSYKTIDGSAQIPVAQFNVAFPGGKVVGFLNSAKVGSGDEAAGAVAFLKNLKPAQFLVLSRAGNPTVLGVSMSGATVEQGLNSGEITPYGYCSSSPRYNTKSFDLWVDIITAGKITRICNWSDKPLNPTSTAYP
jgi:type II secretory pathway pseudopilin PulG